MKRNKSIVSLLLVFFLAFSLVGQAFAEESNPSNNNEEVRNGIQIEFEDSNETPSWAEGHIGKMQTKGVITGNGDGTFRPNAPVTRIEAIVMAVRLMGLEEEAKAKSTDIQLHFKDANQIPNWGRGHVVVALENGLFDLSEDNIQPKKPASRLWIVNLLVRALDLESEALTQMTKAPEFADANQIPAGSVGYVNVAIEHGVINGYGDNTFKPNKNVTRAEMAAFLDRTNDGLMEQAGAITVLGTITDTSFGSDSVTNDVYGTNDGTITIQFKNGDSFTYVISSDLLVQYHNRFIAADQLLVDDVVILVVQDNKVLEANLVDDKVINEEQGDILEFKVEIEGAEDQSLELKYKNKKGKIEAEIEQESNNGEVEIKGEEAVNQVNDFITSLGLTSDITKEELLSKVLTALDVSEADVKELEIKVKFADGTKIEVEFERDEDEEEDEDEDENEDGEENEDQNEGYFGVREFKVDIKLVDKGQLKIAYKHEGEKVKAEIEKKTDNEKESLKGESAAQLIESLLDELALTEDMDKDEVLELVLSVLNITQDDVKDLNIEVKFSDGEELEIEMENEDEEDEEDED
jgi:hypothetical protein